MYHSESVATIMAAVVIYTVLLSRGYAVNHSFHLFTDINKKEETK